MSSLRSIRIIWVVLIVFSALPKPGGRVGVLGPGCHYWFSKFSWQNVDSCLGPAHPCWLYLAYSGSCSCRFQMFALGPLRPWRRNLQTCSSQCLLPLLWPMSGQMASLWVEPGTPPLWCTFWIPSFANDREFKRACCRLQFNQFNRHILKQMNEVKWMGDTNVLSAYVCVSFNKRKLWYAEFVFLYYLLLLLKWLYITFLFYKYMSAIAESHPFRLFPL